MTEPIHTVLCDLRAGLEALYGDRLAGLVLYGSHARGEASDESDVDVMVVLHDAVDPAAEVRKMSRTCLNTGLRHDVLISVYPISKEDYESCVSRAYYAMFYVARALLSRTSNAYLVASCAVASPPAYRERHISLSSASKTPPARTISARSCPR